MESWTTIEFRTGTKRKLGYSAVGLKSLLHKTGVGWSLHFYIWPRVPISEAKMASSASLFITITSTHINQKANPSILRGNGKFVFCQIQRH